MRTNNKSALEELMSKRLNPVSKVVAPRSGNVCYTYDRVSSRDQMINGNSLAWQFERLDEYAVKNNLVIKNRYGGTYESAKTDERKEFKRMLADIAKDKSVSAILIYSYDRFSRSGANGIFLLENLKKLGVKIIAVTQEVDSFTPTGSFQENLYMLLSNLDNDMRRDKSISGTKSMIKKGYWPYSTPRGYTNTVKYATADKHIYVINDEGKLLRKAFEWKASGKFSNQQIIDKLALKGMAVTLRYIAWIFANPFYCGYVYSSLLPGELIPGKHPALIIDDTFLKANNISKQNAISGVPKKLNVDELPLKVFVRDKISNSPFTGYQNKKKKLFYYKTRDAGTNINISAKKLNSHFEKLLQSFEYDNSGREKLKTILNQKLSKHFDDNKVDEVVNKKRVTELQNNIDKLEERFVLNEITKEQYDKFSSKYRDELVQLKKETKTYAEMSSNLEKAVEKGLNIAENISQLWISSDYYEKQQLQYLVFPEGMLYDKKNDTVRTNRINTLFREIAIQSKVLDENKNDNPFLDCHFVSNVGMARFELATSWSQTRRDNRATLHPERYSY